MFSWAHPSHCFSKDSRRCTNRVFRDNPGGLIVDYLGLADELKQALATYTESGGTGKTAIDQAEAMAVMLEKYEICQGPATRYEVVRS